MTKPLHAARPILGVLLMIASVCTIPLVDGIAKHLSAAYTVMFVAWARCCSGAIWVLPFGLLGHRKEPLDARGARLQLLRTVLLLIAMMLYYAAIARVPMADALGAYFISPIVVTILSRVILRERLTVQRVLAVTIAFAGVLVVIRPGVEMDVGLLLAAASGTTFAIYIIVTRIVSRAASAPVTLAFQYVAGALLLSPFVLPSLPVLEPDLSGLLLLMGVLSVLSHALEIAALRYAQASILAPFMYMEIASATIVGYVAFHDFPDVATCFGIAVVVAGGLILTYQRTPSPAPALSSGAG